MLQYGTERRTAHHKTGNKNPELNQWEFSVGWGLLKYIWFTWLTSQQCLWGAGAIISNYMLSKQLWRCCGVFCSCRKDIMRDWCGKLQLFETLTHSNANMGAPHTENAKIYRAYMYRWHTYKHCGCGLWKTQFACLTLSKCGYQSCSGDVKIHLTNNKAEWNQTQMNQWDLHI